jgi:hypothetical protein
MHADLDLLCISVYCTADDLLPVRPGNARGRLRDAEIVTLCVAQVLMGIPSDRRFPRAARRQLVHLFPQLPSQDALHKRRARLAETIEWLIAVFAAQEARQRMSCCCCLTRHRSNAVAPPRRHAAPSCPRSAATATRRATPAGSYAQRPRAPAARRPAGCRLRRRHHGRRDGSN